MSRQLSVVQELEAMMDERARSEGAPLPEKSQCLYVEPLPNGDRKNCKNCALWDTNATCLIHDPTIHIPGDWVCGYWVGGRPQENSGLRLEIKQYIPPSLTGLGAAPDGTACDNCKWYKKVSETEGRCQALEMKGHPAHVQPRACCSRWEQ